VQIGIMIEGQDGLTWPRWQALAATVERLGFDSLYRSDHFLGPDQAPRDALELWTSLTWLASHTRRIAFGPLVAPLSFRHPVLTAATATAIDDLSGGRLRLGLGAGWIASEHVMYGFPLLDLKDRFDRFEEGLTIIAHLLRSEDPLTFQGKYYKMENAVLLPRPRRQGGPSIVVGGKGMRRSLPLAAQYADEWNVVFVTSARFAELSSHLDRLLESRDRAPSSIRRSLMTGLIYGRTEHEVGQRLAEHGAEQAQLRGLLVGTADRIAEQVQTIVDAGADEVILEWLDLDDLEGLTALAEALQVGAATS